MVSQPSPDPTGAWPDLTDPATGLPLLPIFDDRLAQAHLSAERRSEVLGLVLMDFDAVHPQAGRPPPTCCAPP